MSLVITVTFIDTPSKGYYKQELAEKKMFLEKELTLIKYLYVGAGGFVGSILRYAVAGVVSSSGLTSSFPLGTFTVNMAGCFLMGFGGGLMEDRQIFSPEVRMFLFIGMLGSFTTFSTFGYESFVLARDGQWLTTLANITLQVFTGLLAVWGGFIASRLL